MTVNLLICREVWPENDCFGNSNMQADEEFLAMREIFMANIGQPTGEFIPSIIITVDYHLI